MKVLITGGAGFIGYHLAHHHLARGDDITILDKISKTDPRADKNFHELINENHVKYLQIDLARSLPRPALLETDIVYHLAAINGTRLFYEIPYVVARDNLAMTLNLLGTLEKRLAAKLVYASTSEVYAGCEEVGLLKIPTDETIPVVFPQPTNRRFSYGTSKFMSEFLFLEFGRQFHVPVSVVRYHNIYGPRMGNLHVIPELILRLRDGQDPLQIYGGDETRSFCYVDDAVEANYRVATTSACNNEILHVGNPYEEISIRELAKLIMEQMGQQFGMVECGRRSASVSRRCPDISKLEKLTGFRPKVGLKDGLSRTVHWYCSHLRS